MILQIATINPLDYNQVMKKFDFFNKYRDPVIVIRGEEEVVFKNNRFCRVFNEFENIRKFAHKMNFDMCPIDSENMDLYSPLFQAITSKEDFFARVNYTSANGDIVYYDMTATKRGMYTIFIFTDVSSEILLQNKQYDYQNYQNQIQKLQNENDEIQEILKNAQTQAFKIALINKMSNIIRESMDISVILNSALKELSMMFGCYKACYAQAFGNKFKIIEVFGEEPDNKDSEISFDNYVMDKIRNNEISIGYTLSEYVEAPPFKNSVLRIVVPVFHIQKIIGVIVLLSYQKREFGAECDILDAVSSQLCNAIIRAELYIKNAQNVRELKQTLEELKETQLQLINSEKMASLG